MSQIVQHQSNVSHRGLSPAIWGDFKVLEAKRNYMDAMFVSDDFNAFNGTVTSNVGTYASEAGGWYSYEDTGGAITQMLTEVGGVVQLLNDATQFDSLILKLGNNAKSVQAKITSATTKGFMFEARVRFPQITTQNVFIGMAEEALAADSGIFADTTGAVADKDLIAFAVRANGTTALEALHNKAGGGGVVDNGDAKTLVAATWYKLGVRYFPAGTDAQRMVYYVDGVPVQTVASSAIAAATFPSGEELAFYIAVNNPTAVAKAVDIDWMALGSDL